MGDSPVKPLTRFFERVILNNSMSISKYNGAPIVLAVLAVLCCLSPLEMAAQKQLPIENKIALDETRLTLPCRPGARSYRGDTSSDFVVHARVDGPNVNEDTEYRYEVTGGYLMNSGREVDWNMESLQAGTYQISVTPYLNNKPSGPRSASAVMIQEGICEMLCECPTLSVTGPEKTANGQIISFSAEVSGGATIGYAWTVENGELIDGQGTSTLKIRASRTSSNKLLKATVEISGVDPSCNCMTTASASTYIIN